MAWATDELHFEFYFIPLNFLLNGHIWANGCHAGQHRAGGKEMKKLPELCLL